MALRPPVPLLALLALVPAMAAAVELDPGGFSVSFSGAGEVAVTGEELLLNPGMETLDAAGRPAQWLVDCYVWLPVPDDAAQRRMLKRLTPLLEWGSSREQTHSGQQAMRLGAPLAAYLPSDPPHEFCGMFHQAVPLPALEAPTRYLLTWHYRGVSPRDIPNSRPYARVSFYDNTDPDKAQSPRVYAQEILASSSGWRKGQLEFTAPRNTRCLDVRLALTGPGEACYDDVSLKRVAVQDQGVSARIMPAAYVDNLFCLSHSDAGTMCFGFRNETGQALKQPQLVLRLPEGIEVLETVPAVKLSQQATAGQTEFRFDVTPVKSRIHDGTFAYPYNQWDGLQVLVRTRRPASSTRLPGRYWMEDGIHITASEVQQFVAERLPPGKRTQLYAFPYGSYEGATEPEAIAFEMLTYLLHGYRGAIVYLWPGGCDARYWRALAEGNRQMALIEPYVSGVASVKRHTVTAETPLPPPDPRFLDGFGPVADPQRWQNLPLLLSWEFAQGESRLIAVGNFWEQGECFFRLTPQDVGATERYVLREPATGRVFAGPEGVALTASELAKGFLLHVGALRYACFVLEPYRPGSSYEVAVKPGEMERAKAERLPVIRRRL